MKNIEIKFRGWLPQNLDKTEDQHPDFCGKLSIWSSRYESAAWLGTASNGRPYIDLRLTNEQDPHQEKIKLAIWKNTKRTTSADPNFVNKENIFECCVTICAWILEPAKQGIYRLEFTIEPVTSDVDSLTGAAAAAKIRLTNFVREAQLTLPVAGVLKGVTPQNTIDGHNPRTAPNFPHPAAETDAEPDDIPF